MKHIFQSIYDEMCDRNTSFALKIAYVNSFSFILTVFNVSSNDAQISSHVLYGLRIYKYGFTSAYFAMLIFALTFFLIRNFTNLFIRCLGAFVPLMITTFLVNYFFMKRELPHAGLVGWTIFIAVSSLAAVWFQHALIDLSFLDQKSIKSTSRIERLKGIIVVWQTILYVTAGSVLAGFVTMANLDYELGRAVVSNPVDAIKMNIFTSYELIIVFIALLICPLYQIASNLIVLSSKFKSINDNSK